MKRTMTAAVAGVALAGLIGAGVASAAQGTNPGQRLADVLSGLVSDGTLSQDQADDVTEALTDARDEARAERQEHRTERLADVDALLQETLGMDSDTLREQLRDGQTLLEIAGDSADDLAAGALELMATHLDEAVDAGRLTDEQAESALQRAQERADAWLAGDETGPGAGLALLMGRAGGGAEGRMGPGGRGPAGMGQGRGHAGLGEGRGGHMGQRGWAEDDSSSEPAPSGSASANSTSWSAI